MARDFIDMSIAAHFTEDRLTAFVEGALQAKVVSSLAQLIEDYLVSTPDMADIQAFQAIRRLNQGTIDHLSRSDFVSYLVAYAKLSVEEISHVRQALRTFTLQSASAGRLRMAARGAEFDVSADSSELATLLARRIS